ncbi:NAD(P)(+) transhydrogenase (Re/Si-specific) subunit beta [Nocardiopsis sp. NPDC055879]
MSAEEITRLAYLVPVALFVLGIKRLARVRTARTGNLFLAVGVLLAVIITLVEMGLVDYTWMVLGFVAGGTVGVITVLRASATSMPQVVARFNGFSGAAAALVGLALFWEEVLAPDTGEGAIGLMGAVSALALAISVVVGAATLSGSILAEAKLWGRLGRLTRIPGRGPLIVGASLLTLVTMALSLSLVDVRYAVLAILLLLLFGLAVGFFAVAPVGGADMPVMISLLNSVSGLAVAASGFAIGNTMLIMGGIIVGAAGLMLTQIMCVAMNRTLLSVFAGGLGEVASGEGDSYENVVGSDPEDAAMVLDAARNVVIVPGYGLAAARAQQTAADLADALAEQGVQVRFAIHPVAGRMPGHMNVVLAEANVPYDRLVEMERINSDFPNVDLVIVVGANDVVNPAANRASGSPIAGMPILDVENARRVMVVKRSLSPGYAGIKNELFERDHCTMLFGDAKQVLEDLVREFRAGLPAP